MGLPATGMQAAMRHGGRADLGPGQGGREHERDGARNRDAGRQRQRQGGEKHKAGT